MKEVMIILRPKMYFPTKDALDQAGFHSMTIREIIGGENVRYITIMMRAHR